MKVLQEHLDLLKSDIPSVTSFQSVDGKPYQPQTDHLMYLMQTFRWRSAVWAEKLSKTEPWYDVWDIAGAIDPDIRASDEYFNKFFEHVSGLRLGLHIKIMRVLKLSFHWVLLKSMGKTEQFDLPDPFEPIVQFYLGGGNIVTENFFMEIWGPDGMQVISVLGGIEATLKNPIP